MKAIINNYENFHLVNVGLTGNSTKIKIDNKNQFGNFNGLKFASTSYNNNVILILLFINNYFIRDLEFIL